MKKIPNSSRGFCLGHQCSCTLNLAYRSSNEKFFHTTEVGKDKFSASNKDYPFNMKLKN